jgi:hypothetical protein
MIWKKYFYTDSVVIETEKVMDLLILEIDYKNVWILSQEV